MRSAGAWRLNEDECTLTQGETTRQLSPRSVRVLVALLEKSGQVVTSKELQERFWPHSYSGEHGLHKAISEIRTALGDDPKSPRFIKTYARRGYSFLRQDADGEARSGLDSDTVSRRVDSASPPKASVAVLPFVNISGDPDNEYFSDGLTEELLNVLTNIKELKVAARTSSFHFKGRTGDIADIAGRLGVASILEGSVRQSSTRIRITAQLINAADGYHVWSETFDRELDDIFVVQDEIASAVAKTLKVKLLGTDRHQLTRGGTNSNAALKAYLLGEHHRNRGDKEEAVRSAIAAYKDAIALDPDYAKAYVGIARAWSQMALNSFVSYEEGVGNMEASLARAFEIEPYLAEAHLTRGHLLFYLKQDLQGANVAFRTALELNPGNVEVQIEYSRIECYQRHFDEGIDAARKALDLDPVALIANHFFGHILYFSRRYDEAIPALRHTLEIEPEYPKPHYFIAMALFWQGEVEAAWEEIQLEPLDWMRWTASAMILHRLGRLEEAQANLAKVSEEDDQEFATIQRADIYAQWGDFEMAFRNLDLAIEYGDPGLSQVLVDPSLDPLRTDPRFTKILVRLGFKPAAD